MVLSILQLLASLLALVSAARAENGAMVWAYRCDNDTAGYQNLVNYLLESEGVTSVSFCAYRIDGNGAFSFQTDPYGPSGCGQNAERFGIAPLIAARSRLKQYPLIDNHAGLDSMRVMLNSTSRRRAFIEAAVAKMQEVGFDGYNLDMEIPAEAEDGLLYATFVKEFADSLHAVGGVLSSDIGRCGVRGYMGMQCVDYQNTGIDSVSTMKTYTHDVLDFRRLLLPASQALSSSYWPGVSNDIPDRVAPQFFAELQRLGLRSAAIWACGRPPCWNESFAMAMQQWYAGKPIPLPPLYNIQSGIDCKDEDLLDGSRQGISTPESCADACSATNGCAAWTVYPARNVCYLKSGCSEPVVVAATSGTLDPKPAPSARGIEIHGTGGCGGSPCLQSMQGSFEECSAACISEASCIKFQRQQSANQCWLYSRDSHVQSFEPNLNDGWQCGFISESSNASVSV